MRLIRIWNVSWLLQIASSYRFAIEMAESGPAAAMDRALVRFFNNPTDSSVALYASNSMCLHCIGTDFPVSSGNSSNEMSLWTPFPWIFTLVDKTSGSITSSRVYSLREHGYYTVTLQQLGGVWDIVISSQTGDRPIAAGASPSADLAFPMALSVAVTLTIPVCVMLARFVLFSSRRRNVQSAVETDAQTSVRCRSIDTMRGAVVMLMIFVNYGGGGYWFFRHYPGWNGVTVADLVFPWFVLLMGMSLGLSTEQALADNSGSTSPSGLKSSKTLTWLSVIRRSAVFLLLGILLNNVSSQKHWRLLGVLQYFAIAYFYTAATILTATAHSTYSVSSSFALAGTPALPSNGADTTVLLETSGLSLRSSMFPRGPWWSRLTRELPLQVLPLALSLYCTLAIGAPDCPVGYNGPGGTSENGRHRNCSGGIHTYIDITVVGKQRIYQRPNCQLLYHCTALDPESILGSLTACTVAYVGLVAGRVLPLCRSRSCCLSSWTAIAAICLLNSGILCGFSQDNGLIPISKNLWSLSYGLFSSGLGILLFIAVYLMVDDDRGPRYSGVPFLALGRNSTLLYIGHVLFRNCFPFSYRVSSETHLNLVLQDLWGTFVWTVVAHILQALGIFVHVK